MTGVGTALLDSFVFMNRGGGPMPVALAYTCRVKELIPGRKGEDGKKTSRQTCRAGFEIYVGRRKLCWRGMPCAAWCFVTQHVRSGVARTLYRSRNRRWQPVMPRRQLFHRRGRLELCNRRAMGPAGRTPRRPTAMPTNSNLEQNPTYRRLCGVGLNLKFRRSTVREKNKNRREFVDRQ